jgi:outer membrane receptor for ferrienterochelin and colicins
VIRARGLAVLRGFVLLLGLVLPAGGGTAHAGEPALDVADLPPLPVAGDAPSSSAAVLAASSAEEDVVVGAAKREQSLGNVASAVTVISGDRIRRFGYRTVGEAIGAVAGAYLVDNRLSYSIGIRGLQIPGDFNTRLLVLIDGATVNEAWGSFAGLGYDGLVSIDEVARIEVIRGPVSSVYGTSAFFGTINIVTRGAGGTPHAWATSAINSVNGAMASAGFTAGDVHRQLRGSVHVMDRIGDTTHLAEVPGGTATPLTGDGSSALSAALAGAYDGSFAQVRAYRYNRQSPFAPYDGDPSGTPYQQHDTQLLVEGGHTRALSQQLTVAGRAYGNFYQFNDRAVVPGNSPLDTVGTAQTGGGELRARYEVLEHGRLGITAGNEASVNRTTSIGYFESVAPVDRHPHRYLYEVDGTYAELDAQPAPWLGFTGGVRNDLHHDRDTGFRDKVSPRVAVFLAEPERYGLKLLYAEGFRYASAFESHFEDGHDFVKNVDIEPEAIDSFEAVAWAKPLPGLSLRLSAFWWTVEQVIEQQPVIVNGVPGFLQFQSGGSFRSRGLEVEASYRDIRGWYAFGGFAYSRVGAAAPREDGTLGKLIDGHVPNAPAITASGGVSTPRLFDRVHVSSELTVIGERPTRPDEAGVASPASPAWVGWNATLYAPNIAGFEVTAGVRNLLGTRDRLPAPGDYDRTVQDPAMPGMTRQQVVARVPGEAREVYVKVGYSY